MVLYWVIGVGVTYRSIGVLFWNLNAFLLWNLWSVGRDDFSDFLLWWSILFCQRGTCRSRRSSWGNRIRSFRRRNRGSPIEFSYYTIQHTVKSTVGRCAFCGDKLNKLDTKTVKTLLDKECKVFPSCGKEVCLSMNPKANFSNGWTVKMKQMRKRKQPTAPKAQGKGKENG